MIGLLQRVSSARVDIDGVTVGAIERGLLVLVCAERGDDEVSAGRLLERLLNYRVFSDALGKMNLSLVEGRSAHSGLAYFYLTEGCPDVKIPRF